MDMARRRAGGRVRRADRSAAGDGSVLSDFVSNGQLTIPPGGTLNGSAGGVVLGGGSVTNIGIFNPNNGQVTPGGTLEMGPGNLVIQGALLRNNGTIHGGAGSGDIVIDYLGLLKGTGDIDTPRAPIRINGGQLLAG